ncbi:unnamed protein product [Microthlaspi erraticum]|uniref:Uncharacterized protein n=1 Tax=Microthlaspi erraticum TaxID=1685480 RepID=A0A6D2K4W7_9BRAS|nr:unnamed protein product [Microthlaspi erraticum]
MAGREQNNLLWRGLVDLALWARWALRSRLRHYVGFLFALKSGGDGVAALSWELLLPSLICFFGGSMNGSFFFFMASLPFVLAIGYLQEQILGKRYEFMNNFIREMS